MQTQNESNPNSAMLKELAQTKEAAKNTAKTGEGGNSNGQAEELPQGSSPLEAREETPVDAPEASEETPETPEGEPTPTEEPIRIGTQTFKNQTEAFAWAEDQERQRELTEAHAAGIRETLEATRVPVAPAPEPEDNFEERFYSNPKEALKEVQARATRDALAAVQAETHKEKLWNQFLGEYPEIRRKDAERILKENMDTIGKMTDVTKAMKAIATKVRSEYQEIAELTKPRTALANKTTTVAASGGSPSRVTPQKKDDRPLSFAEEMRKMRGSR